jgi:hypothetical protein
MLFLRVAGLCILRVLSQIHSCRTYNLPNIPSILQLQYADTRTEPYTE